MQIWGKVLGFLFGFMLSKNIFGALLGLWLGHSFDKGRKLDFNNLGGKDSSRQAEFFYTTFSVMGYIAKANGQVTSHEIAFATAYMDKLGLNGEMRQQAQDAFREGKTAGFLIDERLNHFKQVCGNRHDLLLLFLEIQIQVAFADGELDTEERKALHKIAQLLGYSARDLDKLLEMMIAGAQFHQQSQSHFSGAGKFTSKQQVDIAYKLLGVDDGSSERDIKKAYRKLMSQHHPDKLIAKGLPPEMMEIAKQKTQDIQAAYELVSKK
ncbi:MAG: co-chaperone DjlA [Alteromonadaceae bacterium]|nr:co-chaperone DjlA [Alteromonadaceae bacterium]